MANSPSPLAGRVSISSDPDKSRRRPVRGNSLVPIIEETPPIGDELDMVPSTEEGALPREMLAAAHLLATSAEEASRDNACAQTVQLWLRWNAAFEQITAQMHEPGQNFSELQDMLDQLDQLRSKAVALSEDLID